MGYKFKLIRGPIMQRKIVSKSFNTSYLIIKKKITAKFLDSHFRSLNSYF